MKMRNTVPRVGFKPTSLAFQASMLPLHHIRALISPLYPYPPVHVALCLSADYYTHPLGIVSHLMLQLHTYRQWPSIYIHRVN